MSANLIPFVHLGARSEVSLGESIAGVEELCWEASRDEQGFLGLTDVDSLGRAPAFAVAAARAGLRPVFGAELSLLPYGEVQFRGGTYRVRLLVENETGWRNLVRLVNAARAGRSPGRPSHVGWGPLLEDLRGLVLFLGGEKGEITHLLREGDFEKIERMVGDLANAAGRDRLFVELPVPRGEARRTAEALSAIAAHFDLMTVAVPRIRCAHAADDSVMRFYAGEGGPTGHQPPRRLGDLARPLLNRDHLATRAMVADLYKDHPHALDLTLALAQHCSQFTIPQLSRRFPIHDFNRGVDAESYIWNTAFAKAADRYGDLPTRYKERLNREFHEIVNAGLANAVVSMAKLNEEMDRQGVQRGPGAGLLTNSVVASLLGITRLDPLRFDLPFELPSGLGKGSFPLLELSIPANQEEGAVTALDNLFDRQVAHVGEWRTWRQAACLERAAEVLAKDGRWAAAIARNQSFTHALRHAQQQPAAWTPDAELPCESMEGLAWLVARMEGRARELVAATGVYTFTVDPVDAAVPLQRLDERDSRSRGVCEWTGEELGRLRHGRIAFHHSPLLDLIGVSTEIVRQQGDFRYTPESTPADDGTAYRLLREGNTAGIGPLESPSIRRRLRQGQPSDLHTLIRLLHPQDETERAGMPEFSMLLLCHVCAAIKAHRPLAFFAAALSQVAGDLRRTALLLEEARERSIEITDIDINLSTWNWTVERNAIRPGLVSVRGLPKSAAQEILTKRRELHYTDLADLCRRTDKTKLKAPHLRLLLKAGAFDRLAKSRNDAMCQLEDLYPIMRGKKSDAPGESDELAFFDRDGSWWLREHGNSGDVAAGDEDPAILCEQQRQACGVAFNEYFDQELRQFLRTAQVKRPSRLNLKMATQAVTLIGMIGPIECENGDAGNVTAEIGGCSVGARARLGEKLAADDLVGGPVLMTGVLKREPFQWHLELAAVESVRDAHDRARQARALSLDLSSVDDGVQKQLLSLLKQYPGGTPLRMEWIPVEPRRVFRSIQTRRVTLCPMLELGLDRVIGHESWRVVAQSTGETPRESRTMIQIGASISSQTIQKLKELLRA